MSERGIVLKCSWCRKQSRLDLTSADYNRAMADHMLFMLTGGHRGSVPPGLPVWSAVGTDLPLGKSECCDAQIEGELYGYPDTTPAPDLGLGEGVEVQGSVCEPGEDPEVGAHALAHDSSQRAGRSQCDPEE